MNWFKPTNPKYYDHYKAFSENDVLTWSSVKNIDVGDIVYLYSSYTDRKITHRCIVEKINVTKEENILDDKYVLSDDFDNEYHDELHYINLRVLEIIDKYDINYEKLRAHGLTNIQSMNRMSDELSAYIETECKRQIPKDEEQEYFEEGNKIKIVCNKYERDPNARDKCIAYYGEYVCQICGFDFEKTYGELGRSFIEVHHKTPLSAIGSNYKINPQKDLIPICPNCHAMIHRRLDKKPINEDILKNILRNRIKDNAQRSKKNEE